MVTRSCIHLLLALAAVPPATAFGAEPLRPVALIGAPCEGCEAAFDGVPSAIPTRLDLRREAAGGTPLTVSGRVLDASGQPRAGVVIYLHQTDADGDYPTADAPGLGQSASRHGRLRGWVRSDTDGRYVIDTIRPGGYPRSAIPEHIHMQVIEPGCFTYLVDDLMFRDDPRLTAELQRQLAPGRGGAGVITPEAEAGGWRVRRDILLGRGIDGHRDCRAPRP